MRENDLIYRGYPNFRDLGGLECSDGRKKKKRHDIQNAVYNVGKS